MNPTISDAALGQEAVDLCRDLIRFDTTNPPGDERACADFVAERLTDAGLEPVVLDSQDRRRNVVARLKGTGDAPPLLLTGHIDVVPASPEYWTHPPFEGVIADGCLWGRGAVDMKNHVAMSLALIRRMAKEGITPKRDIIFAAVADEEQGCRAGSLWLCENHPELVQAEYALGEGGGFNIHFAGKPVFTMQVAEKGVCWMRARLEGPPGHGSMPRRDSAVVRLAHAIGKLGREGLPVHRTPVVEAFLEGVLAEQPAAARPIMRQAFRPEVAPHLLPRILPPNVHQGLMAMLANTASPTVFRSGRSVNVIPPEASIEIDGRYLPGQTEADFLRELRAELDLPELAVEVMHSMPPILLEDWNSPLHQTIHEVMRTAAPGIPVVPYMLPGFTDAKAFASIGVKWVGFAPVKLPKEMRFADLFHAHDERIPVDGLAWGARVLADIVTRYACRS